METVLLVIHVIIALALIGMVLIQRSESDGFGLGSGGGSNFMTGRATANFLTRTTAILATLFILNSLALGIIASHRTGHSIVDTINNSEALEPVAPAGDEKKGDVLDKDATATKKAPAAKADAKAKAGKEEPSVPTGE